MTHNCSIRDRNEKGVCIIKYGIVRKFYLSSTDSFGLVRVILRFRFGFRFIKFRYGLQFSYRRERLVTTTNMLPSD